MALGKSNADTWDTCMLFWVWSLDVLICFCFTRRGMTFCNFLCIGFRFGWSKWTSACISTDILRSCKHIFNWPFQHYRWLSKGDPIALLLCFVFVMKMLKRMIARAARGILIVFQVGKEIEISNFIVDDPCSIFYWKFNWSWLS